MFLTVPPVGDLYYSYAFIDLFTDNFLVVSHRLKGNGLATHMIVGPAWTGDAPRDVTLVRAPTTSVWLLGRILVDGPEELDRVRILQSRVLLETPDMRNERRILETRRADALPHAGAARAGRRLAGRASRAEPFDLFDIGLRALGESPLPERDRPLFEALAPLKLKPGRKFDQRAFSDAERRAIRAGIEQGHADIRAAAGRGRTVDGWTYGERHLGNFGDDYLYRAATALTALGALMPGEAVYVSCAVDAERRPLSGDRALHAHLSGRSPAAGTCLLVAVGLRGDAGGSRLLRRQSDRPLFDRRSNAGSAFTAPTGHSRFTSSASDHRAIVPPTGFPRPPDRRGWCCAPISPTKSLIEGRYRVPPVRRNSSP